MPDTEVKLTPSAAKKVLHGKKIIEVTTEDNSTGYCSSVVLRLENGIRIKFMGSADEPFSFPYPYLETFKIIQDGKAEE